MFNSLQWKWTWIDLNIARITSANTCVGGIQTEKWDFLLKRDVFALVVGLSTHNCHWVFAEFCWMNEYSECKNRTMVFSRLHTKFTTASAFPVEFTVSFLWSPVFMNATCFGNTPQKSIENSSEPNRNHTDYIDNFRRIEHILNWFYGKSKSRTISSLNSPKEKTAKPNGNCFVKMEFRAYIWSWKCCEKWHMNSLK